MDIVKLNSVFDSYVNEYDKDNSLIELKYNHTYRVCKQILNICDSLNLSKEQKDLAYLIALLHDIGRFQQSKEYNTHKDLKSFDHGDYGVEILFEKGLIRKFIIDTKYDDIIKLAIKNHNKVSIEDGLSEEELLYVNLLRDADSIDILYNVAYIGAIKLPDDNSLVSSDIGNTFLNHKLINTADEKTNNDNVLKKLAFVFQLKFDYSYKFLKDNNIVNKIYEIIKNKDIFKVYFEEANKYIDERCNDVRD